MSKDKFTCVYPASKNRFTSCVHHYDKKVYLGIFTNQIDAALAYDKYVRENNLNRRLNFPDPEPDNLIPNTKQIRLTCGYFAIVDESDYDWLNSFKWSVEKTYNNFYAIRTIKINGKKKIQKMHRLIMGENNPTIDHRNRNGLHNYRSNLRVCTDSENQGNRKTQNGTSIYKGVTVFKNRFISRITINRKMIHLGNFNSETEAAKMYDSAARQHFGEFARTNF